ncbi:MAG: hypothetical protein ACHP7K_09785, partial [Actinomycetales bacterium]
MEEKVASGRRRGGSDPGMNAAADPQGSAEKGPRDYIDGIQAQWACMLPQINSDAAGVVGRIRRLAQVIQLRG